MLDEARILDTLGVEMDVDLYTQTPAAAMAEINRLGVWSGSPARHAEPGRRRVVPNAPVDDRASCWRPGG